VFGWRALAFLRERYRVRFDRGIFSRTGYFAGDDERRAAELGAALLDPEVRAIIAMRGGYGASRFVHGLPWQRFAEEPRWIVGFSDITALHVEACRVGVASMHASHANALGWCDARGRARWIDALENPTRPFCQPLQPVLQGACEGSLAGGNLALLHACAAAGRLALPAGCVLFLEDVAERPYRIDRMLTTLSVGGHLSAVSGVVLGEFNDCGPGPDGTTTEHVLRERLGVLGVPVAAGVPSGHGARNDPLLLGARVRLEVNADQAELRSLAP